MVTPDTTPSPAPVPPAYPATLNVDYPDRELNRLTSFFRIFVVIPIFIIVYLLNGILCLPVALMILFRKKYPKWWFDWNLALTRFYYRVESYLVLLRDEYPSTDEEQAVHLNLVYPDAQKDLGRGYPLVKWLLAIPHYIVLCFLYIVAGICVFFAWWAILFSGRYPKGLFNFVVGVGRWTLRVTAYAFLLTTDKYPPFSLNE